MSPRGSGWRPVGFVLLMLGFGLRLDSPWQGLAWVFLLAGGGAAAVGLAALRTGPHAGAFVAGGGGE